MTKQPKSRSGYRANSMGVTTIAAVNGRGAASLALSRNERIRRAERLMKGKRMRGNKVHRAAFVRRMKSNKSRMGSSAARRRAGKRLAAFSAARRRGLSKDAAKRAANRKFPVKKRRSYRRNEGPSQVATPAYRSGHERIYGKKAQRRREAAAKRKAKKAAQVAARKARRARTSERKRAATAKRKASAAARRAKMTPERRAQLASRRRRAKWPKQYRKVRGRRGKTHRVRTHYGPYKRIRATDPRSGRRRYTVMYRGKRAKRRRVPQWAIAGASSAREYKTSSKYGRARERIAQRRKRAAARLEQRGDAFTPNAGAKKVKRKKRRKAKRAARKAGRRIKRARRRTGRKSRVGRRTRRKTKRRGTAKRRRGARRKVRTTKRRRGSSRRRARTGKRRTKRRTKKRSAKRHPRRIGRRKVRRLKRGLYLVKNRRRRSRRRYEENRTHRRSRKGRRRYSANRRRRTSRRRYVANRRYRRNGFGADLKSLLATGGLILVGFWGHKALTAGLLTVLTSTDPSTGAITVAGMATVGADGKPTMMAQLQKPVAGAVVGLLAIGGASMVKQMKNETRLAIGAGVMVSFLQSVVHAALTAADQPKVLSYLEGYQNSAAYALRGARGRRRRGVHGLGVARNATSIMPQYAPVGMFQQAAAGMGEYFAQSGMGEYFAGPGVEGVGAYEKAGPLALQPTMSHMGQLPIDDGIRPDANLDHIMDLSESAAGVGQYRQAAAGMGAAYRQAAAGYGSLGEFFSAAPGEGGFKEFSVGTQSQWIPSGPLWAGTTSAEAAYTESELPAGILQGPGGNGVLSG
jgi:arginine/serine-rich splicing factor 4/5/6/transcription factor SPN1